MSDQQFSILVTHSYFLHLDSKQEELGLPYPPLGTLQALAVLRNDGFNPAFTDVMFMKSPDEIFPQLQQCPPTLFVIYDDGFNYLTKMCLTNMRHAAFEMATEAKRHGSIVAVCSSDATDRYEQYLDKGIDFIITGEGEISLLELTRALESGRQQFENIEGLIYRERDKTVRNIPRKVMRDLDALPLPAWDMVELEPYRKSWLTNAGYFSLNIGTTRGCPFKCNWCAKPIYGNRYHARSPRHVVEELKILQDYNYDHIWFCDDIFGLKPGWVHEFANLVRTEQLDFRFKIQSRADLLIQENYVRDLARAGCETVWIGAESGSQKILDAMDKGITLQQIAEATSLLKRHGIKPCFFIQFGYSGETEEDIQATINMIHQLLPHEIGISVSYPLPGTLFYERVKEELKLKTNWTDSAELALMFHNNFSPEYYKQLHRYVHHSYRQKLAMHQLRKAFSRGEALRGLRRLLSILYHFPVTILQGWKLKSISTRTA